MSLELRPAWCIDDNALAELIRLGPWMDSKDALAFKRDGDNWRPGETLDLRRTVELVVTPAELRRRLKLRAGARVGVAARWSCGYTFSAGVHVDGPAPLGLDSEKDLVVAVPSSLAGSLELETCLVVTWANSEHSAASCPDGALIWSDGWTISPRDRTILLEGSQARIPVRTVSFKEHFGEMSGALWAIELETSIEPDDLLSNVVRVILNKEVLQREFKGDDGEGDASRIPPFAYAGIQVDLVRALMAALAEEFDGGEDWAELAAGSVGALLLLRLGETFGSVAEGVRLSAEDEPAFSRELWNRFAPNSWRAS